jgi:hypothetical protein
MLDAGCLMLDTGCLILDTGCLMLDTGCGLRRERIDECRMSNEGILSVLKYYQGERLKDKGKGF